ncbi:MAG: ABC transporter ATP-binding protein [Deltaproteobacteria bacterium]|nr:ABC transporter ATP-binding protein [Deltaproteobacteria bacterium]
MEVGDRDESIIEVRGLSKLYGEVRALEDVGFAVRKGEVFGYLGPNGAGKTTTVNILCGLVERDAGEVRIYGLDIRRDPVEVKERIGVVPEESNLYPELSCRRNLEYLGELYGLSRSSRRTRAGDLLEIFDLADKGSIPFRSLSRGMKRRLTVAAALLHRPQVIFLDEPTAGLDVPSARALRSLIQRVNREGTTVFLTTHNLAEAESLCSRVLILVKGRVMAEGTAAEIRSHVERTKAVSLVLSGPVEEASLRKACPEIKEASFTDGSWRLEVADIHAAVAQVVSFADRQGVRILEIGSSVPSFEDVFMRILKESTSGGGANR